MRVLYSGPGFRISDFESNRIIGEAQFLGAQRIMNGPLSPVQGRVKSAHAYVTMFVAFFFFASTRNLDLTLILLFTYRANHAFALPNGTMVSTCPAALGQSSISVLVSAF